MFYRHFSRNSGAGIVIADAKPKPEKTAASTPTTTRVLPTELNLGDRIVDETGEYEAGMKAISANRSFTSRGSSRHSPVIRVHEFASPSHKALALSGRDSPANPIEIEGWLSA